MGVIKKIWSWILSTFLGLYDSEQVFCIICRDLITSNEGISIIRYGHAEGESQAFVCASCTQEIEKSESTLDDPDMIE